MTRETKIGLLVGLAFIIIVGILLGDSVRHATDVQPAPLPQVGANVRNAVTTPGTPTAAPPITMQQSQATARNVQPVQTVPTREEVARPQGSGVVVVGPGNNNNSGSVSITPTNSPPQSTTLQSNTAAPITPRPAERTSNDISLEPGPRNEVAQNNTGHGPAGPTALVPPTNPRTANDPLFQAANANGVELVPIGARPANTARPNGAAAGRAAREYEAQSGDSLSKIAARFYGSGTKAAQDAIVAANPSLKENRNRILAGQTYVIPPLADAAPTAPQSAPQSPAPSTASRTASAGGGATEYWYTVKESDTLWRIAKEQVGDAGAVAILKELNKDALKGGDIVRVNMKLRLPGKPVASAN